MTTFHHTQIQVGDSNAPSTINTPLGAIDAAIGDLASIGPTARSSVVAAIGASALSTDAKTTLIAAINEIANEVQAARGGSADLDARLDALATAATATSGTGTTTLTAASAATDTTLEVADDEGFNDGDYITVTLDSGALHATTVNGTPAANIITITDGIPTGANAAIGNAVSKTLVEVALARTELASGNGFTPTLPDTVDAAAGRVFNVQRYGAVGDGSTDDAAAFQAAIDAAEAAAPATVIIPRATSDYVIGTALSIETDNVHIVGVGFPTVAASASLDVDTDSPDSAMFFFNGVDHCSIRGLKLDGSSATSSTGVMLRGCTYCVVSNLWIDTPVSTGTQSGYGVYMVGANHFNKVEYCRCNNAGYSAFDVARDNITPVATQPTHNVYFACVAIDATQDGYDVFQTVGTQILNCYSSGAGRIGINITGGASGFQNRECLVQGNYVTGGSAEGIFVDDYGPQCRIIGNHVQNNTFTGIGVNTTASNNCLIANNIVDNNSKFGIQVGSAGPIVVGNQVLNNGDTTDYNGIDVYSNAAKAQILDNNVFGSGGHGIMVDTCQYASVRGNFVDSNTLSGIFLTALSQAMVANNHVIENQQHGIYLDDVDRSTIVGNHCFHNSQQTNATYQNILVDNNSDYNNIQTNTCERGGTTMPQYGISIDDSTCDGNFVTNNNLYEGGTTGDLNDAGTGTVTAAGNRT